MIKAIYDLDMTPRRSLPIIINVSQNDDLGRTLVFNLFSSTGTWTAPDSATATLEGGKPDGKFFSFNCTYSKGTVTAIIQQQMTAVSGKVVCKVKVQSGNKVIESAPIYMMVDAAGIPDGADMSKSDVNDAVAAATKKIVEQVAGSIPADYSALNKSVDELKSDISPLRVEPQINWINQKCINGINGEINAITAYDLAVIPVNNISHIKAKCYFANNAGYAFLTEDKTYICGSNNPNINTYKFDMDLDVPINATYLYISHVNNKGFELTAECIRLFSEIDKIVPNINYMTPQLIDGKGIVYNNGEYYKASSYSYCEINVEQISNIKGICYFANDFGYAFYDSDGSYISGGKNNTVGTYLYNLDIDIPFKAKIIKISHRNDRGVEPHFEIKYNGVLSDVKGVKQRMLKLENQNTTPSNHIEKINGTTLNSLDTISIDAPNTKSGNVISFFCEIENMSTIKVGHGQNTYSSSSVRVRNNLLEIYRKDKEDVLVKSYETNLTFEKFINIVITTNDNNTANVLLSSDSGVYTVENVEWIGCSGTVYAMAVSGTYTNYELSYYCKDVLKPVWIFGDSYMSMWNVYTSEFGAKNFLNDSYPGRNSSKEQAIASLNKLIQKGKPKIIVWALGMNDQEKVSWGLAQWQTGYDVVKKICKTNNIELILVTIPNTPTMINTSKNEIIKSSGYRYVDIAELVGASEENSPWHDGLLSGDNVHPTELGRKLIAIKFMSDIPEMI